MNMSTSKSSTNGLPVINERAAGINIGSRFHVVAVPSNLSDEPVQTFQAFTADIQRMANWLKNSGVETVVMESTGVLLGARL
jgi:transposase